jgi:hypothetical protein
MVAMGARWVVVASLGAALASGVARADDQPVQPVASNAVFVELVGSAPIGSINYERLLGAHAGLRVGVGYLRATSFVGNELDRVEFPALLTATLGGGAHRIELGAGVVPGVLTPSGAAHRVEVPAAAVVGYRYAPPEGGLLFRASFTPLFDYWDSAWSGDRFIPLGGVSVGYVF